MGRLLSWEHLPNPAFYSVAWSRVHIFSLPNVLWKPQLGKAVWNQEPRQGLGKLAQLVKCLPHKHQDLSSMPKAHAKTLVWGLALVMPALGGRASGYLDLTGQPKWSAVETQSQRWVACLIRPLKSSHSECVCRHVHTPRHPHTF